ncbi:MAG TPA: methionyl-tRNA formyltransferase [Candidatus Binataceae bacterium]|nr:methionyl-tRNA formyltransferase [Candidatus Binataceae bacterium]
MRIALIGQAAFAEKVLQELHGAGEEIVHVYAPPDSGGRPDPLKTKALELGLPLSQPASFKGDKIYQQFQSLNADLAVLAFVTLIVPERVLYTPRLKSICFHPSLLPRHRGASAINWAIIHGDSETGITWFWPDQGIDTGPILIQKRLPIGENDTLGSLYFGRLFPLGVEALFEALTLIKAGKAPAIVQDESRATYEPPCRDEHARVDFTRHAREVHNLVRGCDPQPGAFAIYEGKRVRLYEAVLEPGLSSGALGEIVSIGADGMRIGLEGATLLVKRARVEPSVKKMAPSELVQTGELRAGMLVDN